MKKYKDLKVPEVPPLPPVERQGEYCSRVMDCIDVNCAERYCLGCRRMVEVYKSGGVFKCIYCRKSMLVAPEEIKRRK